MGRGARRLHHTQLLHYLVALSLPVVILVLLFKDGITRFLYLMAISSVGWVAYIHASLFGVIFPDLLFVSLCWNPRSGRAVNPVTKKFMPTMYIAVFGGLLLLFNILFMGYLINYLTSLLSFFYLSWIRTSLLHMLLYLVWAATSPIILAILCYGIISPAGARNTLKSFSRNLINH